MAGRCLTDTV